VTFPPNAYQGDYVRDDGQPAADRRTLTSFLRPLAAIVADTPGLPDAARTDDLAKATARGPSRRADCQCAKPARRGMALPA
jgi:hypothetical protein